MDASIPVSFKMLKEALMKNPILVYPDLNNPSTLVTDATKYAWSAVLIQEHTSKIDGKILEQKHPITYISGLFQGSQLNEPLKLMKHVLYIWHSQNFLSFYHMLL